MMCLFDWFIVVALAMLGITALVAIGIVCLYIITGCWEWWRG